MLEEKFVLISLGTVFRCVLSLALRNMLFNVEATNVTLGTQPQ